jgi:hypothetical protein
MVDVLTNAPGWAESHVRITGAFQRSPVEHKSDHLLRVVADLVCRRGTGLGACR